MSLDSLFRTMLTDVVREVVREELAPKQSAVSSEFLTYREAAELARVTPKTIKAWVRRGLLCAYGEGRVKRVKPNDVRERLSETRKRVSTQRPVDDVVAEMLAKRGAR
jgi:excisionase family DNA binding protein